MSSPARIHDRPRVVGDAQRARSTNISVSWRLVMETVLPVTSA